MNNFRTYQLAVEFYRQCRTLPLKGHSKDQLLRAALSIGLNLIEGRARPSKKEQLRFFYIAMGSLRECQGLLYAEELTATRAWESLDKAGACLHQLIQNAR